MTSPSNDMKHISENLPQIGALLDEVIASVAGRDDIAWFLHIFDPGDVGTAPGSEGRASYIGNVDRAETIAALKELLKYLESSSPDVKAHEVH